MNEPGITRCFACLDAELRIGPQRKGGARIACRRCGVNGFTYSAPSTWPLVGLGEGLKRIDERDLDALRSRLEQDGRRLTAPSEWASGCFGQGDGTVRPVLQWGLLCIGCGSPDASLRRDRRGRGYLTCARGCHFRLFFPLDTSMERVAAWTVVVAGGQGDLWKNWECDGRSTWLDWFGGAPVGLDHTQRHEAARAAKEA